MFNFDTITTEMWAQVQMGHEVDGSDFLGCGRGGGRDFATPAFIIDMIAILGSFLLIPPISRRGYMSVTLNSKARLLRPQAGHSWLE